MYECVDLCVHASMEMSVKAKRVHANNDLLDRFSLNVRCPNFPYFLSGR